MIQNENSNNNEEKEFNKEPKLSPVAAGFIGLIAVFILYQIVGGVLSLLILGIDIENADVNAVRLMTIAGQLLFILLPGLLFAKLIYEDVGRIIRFKYPELKHIILFSIGLLILTPLLQSYLYLQNYFIDLLAESVESVKYLKDLLDNLDKLLESTYIRLLSFNNPFEALLVIVVVAVVPAVSEEVFFRGFVQKSFEHKLKPFLSALITAIFFGFYHFNPYGIIPLIALGVYFGYAAYATDSIFIPVILHFLNNFFAVVLFMIVGKESVATEYTAVDLGGLETSILMFLFISSVFFLYIYFLVKAIQRREVPNENMPEM